MVKIGDIIRQFNPDKNKTELHRILKIEENRVAITDSGYNYLVSEIKPAEFVSGDIVKIISKNYNHIDLFENDICTYLVKHFQLEKHHVIIHHKTGTNFTLIHEDHFELMSNTEFDGIFR